MPVSRSRKRRLSPVDTIRRVSSDIAPISHSHKLTVTVGDGLPVSRSRKRRLSPVDTIRRVSSDITIRSHSHKLPVTVGDGLPVSRSRHRGLLKPNRKLYVRQVFCRSSEICKGLCGGGCPGATQIDWLDSGFHRLCHTAHLGFHLIDSLVGGEVAACDSLCLVLCLLSGGLCCFCLIFGGLGRVLTGLSCCLRCFRSGFAGFCCRLA